MHNNTLISSVLWYIMSKTWRDFREILLETFQVACNLKITTDFSKILEKARLSVALMANFMEFSKILLHSNHNTTDNNSLTNKIKLFDEISLKPLINIQIN